MTHITALIDGSIYARGVCDHTAWAAAQTSASVELLHVLGLRSTTSQPANLSGNLTLGARSDLLDKLASHDAEHAKLAKERGRVILDAAKAELEAAGISRVTVRLRLGDIVEAIHDVEAGAALIILGKRGEAADYARDHLGSNLERIVRAATKPVLVASQAFKPVRRALIAFDGGPSAQKAVAHLAKGRLLKGVTVDIVSVGEDTAERRTPLEDAAEALRAGGHTVTAQVLRGKPEEAIAGHIKAHDIDLLVMGAYGHSRLRALFIGSTTTEMLRSSPVPVMLFR
ncbi:universal stress protein [Hyphomonadaceae bacterium BL14]|nr:universal stress protein [Hyphomonadaceae bacterium BL14]